MNQQLTGFLVFGVGKLSAIAIAIYAASNRKHLFLTPKPSLAVVFIA
jgi:hypothetical protein